MSKFKILRKVRLHTWIALGIIAILLPVIILTLYTAGDTQAEWFNEDWSHRIKLTFGNTGSADSNKVVNFTVDTATPISDGNMQSACEDVRFTDASGKLLEHKFASGGGGAGTPTQITSANTNTDANGDRIILRNSSGVLYAIVKDATDGRIEVWKGGTDGTSWTEQDTANRPSGSGGDLQASSAAIDSADTIHILYMEPTVGLYHETFDTSTDQFSGSPEFPHGAIDGSSNFYSGIAVDSNDVPHMVFVDGDTNQGTSYDTVYYKSRVGGTWNTRIEVEANTNDKDNRFPSIAISDENVPEIVYYNSTDDDITVALGNANDATSFTLHDVDATANTTTSNPSIAVDSNGDTWVGYEDSDNTITLVQHQDADGWTTWQTPVSNSNTGQTPSLAAIGTDIYVLYEENTDNDIMLDMYDGAAWQGEETLETGTFSDVKAKWALNSNNTSSGTTSPQTEIDYVFEDGTDIHYNQYSLSGAACDDASSSIDVLIPSIVAGDNAVYMYYGNPSATSTERATDFTQDTFSPTSGPTEGSEEKGPGPLSYWKLDESVDNSCTNGTDDACDGTAQGNDGAFGATTAAPTWQKPSLCAKGSCLLFDGSDDVVSFSSTAAGIQSISFWVKIMSDTTTEQIIDLNGTDYFTSVNGTLTVNGFGTETIYVDGVSGATTLTPSKWHHVVVTTSTATSGSAIKFGEVSSAFGNIFLDEVRLYNYVRDQEQVLGDLIKGSSAVLGAEDTAYLSDGLVGYWKLDESSADTCTGGTNDSCDESGNDQDGAWQGTPTVATGKYGNALSFGGLSSGDYVSIPDSSTVSITGSITVSAWVNSTSFSQNQIIVSKWEFGLDRRSYKLDLDTSGNLQFAVSSDGTGNAGAFAKRVSNSSLSTATWYHVVGVFDPDSEELDVYINGELSNGSLTNTVPSSIFDSEDELLISAQENSGSKTTEFNGTIDETRIYNRALSSAEVNKLYNWAPGPVGYWKMDENTGTSTTVDSSGNGFNMTMNNFAEDDWSSGKVGAALKFTSASSTGLNYSPTTDFNLPDDNWSQSVWFRIDSLPGTTQRISSMPTDGNALGGSFTVSSGDDLLYSYRDSGGVGQNIQMKNLTVITLPQWIHVAATYDGTVYRAYYNGELRSETTDTFNGWDTATDDFWIGSNNGTGEFFDGYVDEFKVYNYTRTSGQIIEDMNAGHPLGGSPIGSQTVYYKFDEANGTTANNQISTQSSITGSISGASWLTSASCKYNNCLDYDGTDDVTTVSNNDVIDFDAGLANGFTFTTWFNADSDGEANVGEIFQKGTNTYCRTDSESGGNLDIECNLDLATTDANVNVSAGASINTWHHLALVYDDASTITVYIDGVNKGSNTGSGDLSADSNDLLIAGGTGANFDGSIDDFKIYSAQLTASEVLIDMNANASINFGTGSPETDDFVDTFVEPAGYWDFNENTGATTFDKGSGQNNGTLTGSMTESDWVPGRHGSALEFDGSDDFVDIGAGPGTVRSISLWVNPDTTTEHIIDLNGSDYLSVSSGTLGFTGDVSETIYVNGVASTTLVADIWQHVVVILSANDNASDLDIGRLEGTDNFSGKIDDVKLFDGALTPAQIAYEYNRGRPIAHWRFDECQGATAFDSSGNGKDLALSIGASGTYTSEGTCGSGTASEMWNAGTTGKLNSALAFDNTDDTASVSSPNLPTGDFSYAFWATDASGLSGTETILMANDGTNLNELRIRIEADGAMSCRADNGTEAQSTTTFASDEWHHTACVRSGSTITLYIDGIQEDQVTEADTLDFGSCPLLVGTGDNDATCTLSATNRHDGLLDDLRIYNYALSASQVRKIMIDDAAARFGPDTGSP